MCELRRGTLLHWQTRADEWITPSWRSASVALSGGTTASLTSIDISSKTHLTPLGLRCFPDRTVCAYLRPKRGLLLKTRQPLILTARIAEEDLEPFERLRRTHFPQDRNLLQAHLTMFHRMPGENRALIEEELHFAAQATKVIAADVSGLRHLGAGVAFSITSPALFDIRAALKAGFLSWLGPQDMQPWRPHITVQNKSSKAKADELYRTLDQNFQPHLIDITGLDLWEYLGGPWRHAAYAPFSATA